MNDKLQSKIDHIKDLYRDAVAGDIRIIEQEYAAKLDQCRIDLNEEMNAEIKKTILSQDNAMRKEIRELKASMR